MEIRIGSWDVMLIAVVSIMATTTAYLKHPKWKAFVLTLPIPFTLAAMAVGRPVDATNVLGLVALMVFSQCVRLLHQELGVPILPSIVLAVAVYCSMGWFTAQVIPDSAATFWLASAATFALGALLSRVMPDRDEPCHSSSLPVWIKLPAVGAVVFLLVTIKSALHGFVTVFPMVGVFAAYEARHSLWTTGRQIPTVMLTLVPMMVICRLIQGSLGLGVGLALGWLGFLMLLVPLARSTWLACGGETVEVMDKDARQTPAVH